MLNLVIDIGNTNHKLAIFKGRDMVEYIKRPELNSDEVIQLLSDFKVTHSTISSVGLEQAEVIRILKSKTVFQEFSITDNPGIINYYGTPATLGLDRWAKVIAAYTTYKDTPCFIIDAGTCVTYDLLNDKGEYFGGSISPGIGMRFDALNHYTKRLPLIEWDATVQDIPAGTDTLSAIKNGVLQGVVNEVIGNITLNNKENKELKVLISGGDASFLLEQLKNSIFAPQIIHDPYLVLKGLNEVIAFEHVQKN
ncbi:MAG: type III pantothenate kinase [Pedobacter sp.]|nr:MAG: type III pantothenate kinase [Pedobacter sp.]